MIVIFGATGNTGPHLVRALVTGGQRVRVAARDPGRAAAAVGVPVEIVAADLACPDTLGPALRGAERVYCGVGGATGSPAFVQVVGNLIDAAKSAGIGQFVHVSGIDAHRDRNARIQAWHQDIGHHLDRVGLPHTTIEPTFFLQNLLGMAPAIRQGVLPMPTGEARCGHIDARDIAEVAAAVLTDPGHVGRRYVLTGPELLSHGDIAALLSRELDRPVQFVDVPAAAFRQGGIDGGLPLWFAELLTDVYVEVFATGRAARVTDDVPRILGRPARSAAAFVRDHRAVFGG